MHRARLVLLPFALAFLLAFALAFMLGSYCLSRVPSRPLAASGSTHPLRALRYVRTDRMFRLTLIAWMLMGMGNLMMFPLRVEFGDRLLSIADLLTKLALIQLGWCGGF